MAATAPEPGAAPLHRRVGRIDALAILVLPFALFNWMLPFLGSRTIGRDYGVYSIQNQLELQFSLRHGTFPLFVPGFAGGAPAGALTLGQLYHPLAWLAAHLPGYWDGKALEWNTGLRLLSLGLTQLALFALLTRLGVRRAFAFGISLVTTYNMRMLDVFRYGASLENYTACLLVSASLAGYFVAPTPRLGPAAIIASTYLLIVGGHPQMAYYGCAAASLMWVLTPFLVPLFAPARQGQRRAVVRFYLASGACLGAGVLLASAYTLPFLIDFVGENASRVGQGYGWATALQDSWGGVLNNFWRPLSSDVHGAFGGSFLPLLSMIAPFGLLWPRRTPAVVWVLLVLCVVTCLYCLGAATPVHRLVWEMVPFQSTVRVPGRAALLLPVLLMWMMAWALKDARVGATHTTPAVLLVLSTLAIVVLVPWLLGTGIPPPGRFHPGALRTLAAWSHAAVLWFGVLSLVALVVVGISGRWAAVAEITFVAALVAQTWVVMSCGTWIEPKHDTPSFAALRRAHAATLTYPFAFGADMYPASVIGLMQHTFFPPQLSRLYRSTVPAASLQDAYRLLEQRQPDVAVIEGDGVAPAAAAHGAGASEVNLEYVSFNRFVFRVVSDEAALLTLAFPFSPYWSATLNDQPARIVRANANENAVHVPAGGSRVEFRYWSPAAMIGMLVSCATLTVVVLGFASTIRSPRRRRLGYLAAVALPIVLYASWSASVYAGTSLETRYHWTDAPRDPRPNLAFGKQTTASSNYAPEVFHLFDSRRAVDGVRNAEAFQTALEGDPWWRVDLGSSQPIAEVAVYGGRSLRTTDPQRGAAPHPPLVLAISPDAGGLAFEQPLASSPDGRSRLAMDRPVVGRFVTIRTGGRAALTLSEVEVYGPAPD